MCLKQASFSDMALKGQGIIISRLLNLKKNFVILQGLNTVIFVPAVRLPFAQLFVHAA